MKAFAAWLAIESSWMEYCSIIYVKFEKLNFSKGYVNLFIFFCQTQAA